MKRARPFGPLEISPSVYNHAVDLYEKSIGTQRTSQKLPPSGRDTRIVVQNGLGVNLPKFSVVAYSAPPDLPPLLTSGIDTEDGTDGDSDSDFFETLCLGTTLATLAGAPYRWGVIQEAIPIGDFGECLVSGVTPVLLNPPAGAGYSQFAQPNGTYQGLDSAQCGMCRVLWRQTGTGLQWAIVNIG